MSSEKIYSFNMLQNHSNFDIHVSKYKFIFLILPILMVSTSLAFNIGTVNAQLNLDDFMKQTQDNIQSTIESSDNNNNNNNNCNNNISIQSQTNDNGKTTSTTKNTCDDGTTTTTSTNNINSGSGKANLNGTIAGSEYNQDTGVIINTMFGNWSLITKDNGSKDFNARFIEEPVYYNLATSIDSGNDTAVVNNNTSFSTQLTDNHNDIGNTTSYHLSNFVGNSVQQQNEDVTYSGKIDVIQEIKSNNATISDETNNYKGVGVSISIIDNSVLFVNFDSQTPLSKEFVYIPIVGLVKQ